MNELSDFIFELSCLSSLGNKPTAKCFCKRLRNAFRLKHFKQWSFDLF